MTDHQILEKAIQKAIDNGWSREAGMWEGISAKVNAWDPEGVSLETIIFNHEFAQALWGECSVWTMEGTKPNTFPVAHDGWQYHLQQMVIANSPIKYLERNTQ